MAWDTKNQGNQGGSKDFIREGNVDILLIKETPTKVRFLTIEPDIDQIMSDQKLTREQATEFVNTVLMFDEWIMPIAHWEHKISKIEGKRYFSKIACQGKLSCPMCAQNDIDKSNGIEKNQELSYPVGKLFCVPVYVYDLKRVLFVKQYEDFFEDVGTYINQNGADSTFNLSKSGKGYKTRYKAIFSGKADPIPEGLKYLSPNELDFTMDHDKILKAMNGMGTGHNTSTYAKKREEEQVNNDTIVDAGATGDAGSFVLPFGKHKGKTLAGLKEEDPEYLTFISTNSAGLTKDKVDEFLASTK